VKKWAVEHIIEHIRAGSDPREAVEEVLSLDNDQQEALLDQVVHLRSKRAAGFLTLLYGRAPDKRLRKLVKKAVFHLRTQGITIEEADARGEPPILKKVETTREARAFLSNYDPEQNRVVVTAFEMKKNQFLFSQGILHFSSGLKELRTFPVGRSDLDDLLNDYISRTPRPMVVSGVSAPYAGYLLEEASAISGKEQDEVRRLNHLLSGIKDVVRRPSDLYLLATPTGVSPASLGAVLGDPIFEPFLLQWTGMDDDRKRLDEVVNPLIVLPPYVIQERREAFLKELGGSERILSRMSPFKRMLEDSAYLFHSLQQFDRYRGLTDILKEPGTIENSLLHFVRRTLDDLEKKAEQQRPDVLVDPHSLVRR
jgi:hypothetical protein